VVTLNIIKNLGGVIVKKQNDHDELNANMLSLKGELVDDGQQEKNPSMKWMKQNPYKTPPNNLTSKNK